MSELTATIVGSAGSSEPVIVNGSWSWVDDHGRVVMHGASPGVPDIGPGYVLVESQPPGDDYYRAADAWVQMPARPGADHEWDWPTHTWIDPRTLDDLRRERLRVINAAFDTAAAALVAGYPALERSTWHMQESEALAWQTNPAAPTPYLDAVADARGIDYDDMRNKTLGNVLLFRAASAQLVGTRQALRDAIADATTREAIEAITWPTPQPPEQP